MTAAAHVWLFPERGHSWIHAHTCHLCGENWNLQSFYLTLSSCAPVLVDPSIFTLAPTNFISPSLQLSYPSPWTSWWARVPLHWASLGLCTSVLSWLCAEDLAYRSKFLNTIQKPIPHSWSLSSCLLYDHHSGAACFSRNWVPTKFPPSMEAPPFWAFHSRASPWLLWACLSLKFSPQPSSNASIYPTVISNLHSWVLSHASPDMQTQSKMVPC